MLPFDVSLDESVGKPRLNFPKNYTHIHNLNGWTMNTVICFNIEGDEVHVLHRVSDTSLQGVLDELKEDYVGFVVYNTSDPNGIVTNIRMIIPELTS